MKSYKIINGTSYDVRVDSKVVEVLERCRQNRTRIILDYGEVTTGKSWGDTNDVTGYVGRSSGSIKIPILVHNARSMGGGSILDHCIIGIKTSKGKNTLYQLTK